MDAVWLIPKPLSERNIKKVRDTFPQLLQELIKSTPGLALESPKKKYINFVPQEWTVPTFIGENGRILYFQFHNYTDSLSLHLIIGPGPQDPQGQPIYGGIRQHLLEIAISNQPPFKPVHKQQHTNWNNILTQTFLSNTSCEGLSEKEIQAEIRIHWTRFLEHDLPQIKAALRTEPRIWQ